MAEAGTAALTQPTADEVLSARLAAGLTQTQAAELVHLSSYVRWNEYERAVRSIDVARWELFLLKTGQHPSLALAKVRARAAAHSKGS